MPADNITLAKARPMEAIEQYYFYQHLCLILADVILIP